MAKRRKKRKQRPGTEKPPISAPVPRSSEPEPTAPAGWLAVLHAQLSNPNTGRIVIAALVVAAYLFSFFVPFLFDDAPVITRNRLLWDAGNVFELIQAKPTRGFTNLTFLINFQLAHLGQVPQLPYDMRDWWSYHLVSVGLHALNSVLLYELVRGLLQARPKCVDPRLVPFVALGAAAVWAVHPSNVMAVAYIAQRYALTAGLGFLLSLVLYVRLRNRLEASGAEPLSELKGYLLVLGCVCVSLTTKENAALVPAAIVLVEVLAYGGRLLPWTALFFLPHALGALVFIAAFGWESFLGRFLPAKSPIATRGEYLVTQVPVTLRYLHLWLFPYDLTVEQAFPILWDGKQGVWNPKYSEAAGVFGRALIGHGLILVLGVKLLLRGQRLVPLALGWFYVTNIVESSFIPILDPMVDHRMYVPTLLLPAAFGIALARSWPALVAWWPRARAAVPLGAVLFVLGLGAATVVRIGVWTSPTEIWQDTLRKRPDCARAYSSLGMEMLYKQEWLGAVGPIETALALAPVHVEGWNNLGKAYLELRQWKDAERSLLRGIQANEIVPSDSVRMCWNNVGLVYMERAYEAEGSEQREWLLRAAYHLRKATDLYEYYEAAYANLAAAEFLLIDHSRSKKERMLHAQRTIEATRMAQGLAKARGGIVGLHSIRRSAIALAELGGAKDSFQILQKLLSSSGERAPLVLEDLAKVALQAHAGGEEGAPELLGRAAMIIDQTVQRLGVGHGRLAILRGQVADARGFPKRAVSYLRQGLEAFPEHPDAESIRKRIEMLEAGPQGPMGPGGR